MPPQIEIINVTLTAHKKKRVRRLTKAIQRHFKPDKAKKVIEEIDRAIKNSEVLFERELTHTYKIYDKKVEEAKATQAETLQKVNALSAKGITTSHKHMDQFMKGVAKITASSTCNIERGDQLASIIQFENLRKNNYSQKLEEKYNQLMQELQPAFKIVHELGEAFNKKTQELMMAYKKELAKVLKHILAKHLPRKEHVVVAI